MKAPARWDLKAPLLLGVLTVGAAVLIMAQRPATSSTRPAMNPPLKHHTVTFPDCRLEFDYPADLKPSPDFFTHRMLTEVDYSSAAWVSPTASDTFVQMNSDLKDARTGRILATLSIEMWLGARPPGFEGDLLRPGELKKAEAAIEAPKKRLGPPREEPRETTDGGISWLYDSDSGVLMTPLNSRIFLRARVSVVPNMDSKVELWEPWAERGRDTVLKSLKVTRYSIRS